MKGSASSRVSRSGSSALSNSSYTWPRRRQQVRLRRLACAWLSDSERSRAKANTIRFDAIAVTVDRAGALLCLDHVEGAW